MAKRKDSVALFEVITAAKKKEAARAAAASAAAASPKPAPPAALRTPKWWFKGKKANADGSTVAAAAYTTPALPPPADDDPTQFAAPAPYDPTTAAPAPGVVQRVVPAGYTAPPERVTIPTASAAAEDLGMTVDPFGLDHPVPTEPAYPDKPRRSLLRSFGGAKKVNLDPDRREVTVRFRYTTAIIVGFAVCVAVGLAYVTGRHANKAKATATGVSSDQVKRGPILAGVLDVAPTDRTLTTNGGGAGGATDADSNEGDASHAQPPKDRPKTAGPTPPATPTGSQPKIGAQPKPGVDPKLPGEANGVETQLPRSVGLNYVVVQSYPDRKSADDAQKALEDAGIPCSVVKGLRDFAADNFWSVVGTHGFSSIRNNPAYTRYEDSILAVSKKYAGTSKYKKFEPTAYRWRAQ
jgi:hypothetical protein